MLQIGSSSSAASSATTLLCALGGGSGNETSLGTAGSKVVFGGRRLYPFGRYVPQFIQPSWWPWYQTGTQTNPETMAANPVPITKMAGVIYDANLNPLTGAVPFTLDGQRGFTIPNTVPEFNIDPLFPRDFGLSAFPAGGFLEVRQLSTLAAGQSMPASSQTFRPGGSQSYRGSAAQVGDLVDAIGPWPMQASGGDELSIFFPAVILGVFGFPVATWLFSMDSIGARQNDFTGIGFLNGRGGYHKVSAFAEGAPSATLAIGGKSYRQGIRGANGIYIARRFTDVLVDFGANDLIYSLFGAAAGTPLLLENLLADNRELTALYRAQGVKRVYCTNIFPRTTDNAWKNTDLANQAPVVTQALASAGAPRDGYGFGPGETMEQFNTIMPTLVGTPGYPDKLVDVVGTTADATTRAKWRVPGVSGVLTGGLIADSTVTISIASPAVVTRAAHGLSPNQPIGFRTTGALPGGLATVVTNGGRSTAGIHFVKDVLDSTTFTISETLGGPALATTGTQSGAHTIEMTGAILDKAVAIGDSVVFEPGNAAQVDVGGQGGPHVQQVIGNVVVFQKTDPLGGPRQGARPAKAHAAGSAWALTLCTDSTHPGQPAHMAAEAPTRAAIRASTRAATLG
ncbi:UNVERIFIED_CONTAM: hypothetical protein Q9R58_27895 [Methylobacteriaceae bacterium AG10]|nr:hypothetical protein [Methylobacteriaceae bacterium AG10]